MEVRERMYMGKDEKEGLKNVLAMCNDEETIDHIEGLLYKAYLQGKSPTTLTQQRYDPNDPRFQPVAGMVYLKDGKPSDRININTKPNHTDNPPGYHADVCKLTPQGKQTGIKD